MHRHYRDRRTRIKGRENVIRITKIESLLGDADIHYVRQRNADTVAGLEALTERMDDRTYTELMDVLNEAEGEAFRDGIELGRVYQASGVGSYADFKNKVRELLEECPPDDISEDLAKFLMDGEEDGV